MAITAAVFIGSTVVIVDSEKTRKRIGKDSEKTRKRLGKDLRNRDGSQKKKR